jgi:hypothetical protein
MTLNAAPKRPKASRRQAAATAAPVDEPDFGAIMALAASLQDLQRQMVDAYTPIVYSLIHSRTQERKEIEHVLDRLLGCASIPEGLALFKTLCRYYFYIDPASTAYYVHAYRDMWDNEADQEQEV